MGKGTSGYSGDGGIATSAEIMNPSGMVIDAAGDMYLVNYANNRIRKVPVPTLLPISGTTNTVCTATPVTLTNA